MCLLAVMALQMLNDLKPATGQDLGIECSILALKGKYKEEEKTTAP